VGKLSDQAALVKIAAEDKAFAVRYAALLRITDQAELAQIAVESQIADFRDVAVAKLDNQTPLAKVAVEGEDPRVRYVAVAKVTSQPLLARIAVDDKDAAVRDAAVAKLSDQALLARIAATDKSAVVRAFAAGRLTDQTLLAKTSEHPGSVERPIPSGGAGERPVSSPSTDAEATLYIYRTGKTFGAGWHALIYTSSGRQAELHLSSFWQVHVPKGYVSIAGITPNNPFFPLPSHTGLLSSIPECSGVDLQVAFASGGGVGAQTDQGTRCLVALTAPLTIITDSLASSGPSEEAKQLCKLHYVQGGVNIYGSHVATWTSGYSRNELNNCRLELTKAVSLLTGNYQSPAPFRIAFAVEAGNAYYVKYTYTVSGGKFELMDARTGAQDIQKFHPVKNQ
jgi:hypothetical protein